MMSSMSPRRRELLAIAARLFAEHGYDNVTIDSLGAAAGISGPALYHHFDSKEALLGEMLVDISTRLRDGGREVVTAARSNGDDADDVIARLIDFHIDFAVRRPDLITVHFRDLVDARREDQHAVRTRQNEYVDVWIDALVTARPELDRHAASAAVHAVLGLMNSTPYSSRIGDSAMRALLRSMAGGALDAAAHTATNRSPTA